MINYFKIVEKITTSTREGNDSVCFTWQDLEDQTRQSLKKLFFMFPNTVPFTGGSFSTKACHHICSLLPPKVKIDDEIISNKEFARIILFGEPLPAMKKLMTRYKNNVLEEKLWSLSIITSNLSWGTRQLLFEATNEFLNKPYNKHTRQIYLEKCAFFMGYLNYKEPSLYEQILGVIKAIIVLAALAYVPAVGLVMSYHYGFFNHSNNNSNSELNSLTNVANAKKQNLEKGIPDSHLSNSSVFCV